MLDLVQQYLELTKKTIPAFQDNRPRKTWSYRFLDRHPEIKLKMAQPLEAARAMSCTESSLTAWLNEFERVVKEKGITSPSQVNYHKPVTLFCASTVLG